MEMTHYHFPFEKLTEWSEMLEAATIFVAVVFMVWVWASLYYWTTKDLRQPVADLPLRKRKPMPKWISKPQPTFRNLDLDVNEPNLELDNKVKRKRNRKKVRQNVAVKNDKDLT
jgi:hypothetical protein